MTKEEIRKEALRTVGNKVRGTAFELGAEFILSHVTQLNPLAEECYYIALKRGKTSRTLSHIDTFFGIFEELREFRAASEVDKSEHLPAYTQAQEELADVLICCLTELHRRETNVEALIKAKTEFNKTRI